MAGQKNLGQMAAKVAGTRDASKSLRAVPEPAETADQAEASTPVVEAPAPQQPPPAPAAAPKRAPTAQVTVRVTPELAKRTEETIKGAFLGRFLGRFLTGSGKTLDAEALVQVDTGIELNPVFRQETLRINFRLAAEAVEVLDRHVGTVPELATRSDVARAYLVLALDEFAAQQAKTTEGESD